SPADAHRSRASMWARRNRAKPRWSSSAWPIASTRTAPRATIARRVASPRIPAESSSAFPADPRHLTSPDSHPLRRALPLFLLAGVCFSTLDATAKWLVQDHTLFLVVWARYMGQMVVVTPIALHRGGRDF